MASLAPNRDTSPGAGPTMTDTPPIVPGVAALAGDFDGFILDIWGVIHDGTALYPGVVDALDRLSGANKPFVMLSNAPSRARTVTAMLGAFGLPERHCQAVVCSGEATWRALKTRSDPWHAALGRRCYLMGAARDEGLLEDLDIDRADSVEDADFIVNTGPFRIEARLGDYEAELAAGAALSVPMICANPDLWVMRGDAKVICAGTLAARYEALGGMVRYHGKPHVAIYRACFERLAGVPRAKVIGIGDTLATDVAGAAAVGLASALVLGGVHADELAGKGGAPPDPRALAELCGRAGVRPDFALPAFAW